MDATSFDGKKPALVTFIGGSQQIEYAQLQVLYNLKFYFYSLTLISIFTVLSTVCFCLFLYNSAYNQAEGWGYACTFPGQIDSSVFVLKEFESFIVQ